MKLDLCIPKFVLPKNPSDLGTDLIGTMRSHTVDLIGLSKHSQVGHLHHAAMISQLIA